MLKFDTKNADKVGKSKQRFTEEQVNDILALLEEEYPEAGCALDFGSLFQLVCAVMLSAQTTDVSVNKVTPELFARYPDAEAMAGADVRDIEEIIHSLGFFHNKARNLIMMSQMLIDNYSGEVPGVHEELVKLPGVGQKTANVVMAEGFGAQAIAVDTHVFRVSNRIGLADAKNVEKTEEQLKEILPGDRWTLTHHLLIFHGRRCCAARKPACERCPVSGYCRYYSGEK